MSDRDTELQGMPVQRSKNWCDYIREHKIWILILVLIILALLWWFFIRKKDTTGSTSAPTSGLNITRTRGTTTGIY